MQAGNHSRASLPRARPPTEVRPRPAPPTTPRGPRTPHAAAPRQARRAQSPLRARAQSRRLRCCFLPASPPPPRAAHPCRRRPRGGGAHFAIGGQRGARACRGARVARAGGAAARCRKESGNLPSLGSFSGGARAPARATSAARSGTPQGSAGGAVRGAARPPRDRAAAATQHQKPPRRLGMCRSRGPRRHAASFRPPRRSRAGLLPSGRVLRRVIGPPACAVRRTASNALCCRLHEGCFLRAVCAPAAPFQRLGLGPMTAAVGKGG